MINAEKVMSQTHDINEKRRTRERLALLALTGGRRERQSHCLASEEMAELVEMGSEARRRQSLWDHLAQCDDCYQQWLVLNEEQRRREDTGKIKSAMTASRPRLLAATGTLLAAAACMVIYFNLPYRGIESDLLEPSRSDSLEMGSEVLQKTKKPEALDAAADKERLFEELKQIGGQRDQVQTLDLRQHGTAVQSKMETGAEAGGSAPPEAPAPFVAAEKKPPDAESEGVSRSFAQFLSQVEMLCRQDTITADQRDQIREQGRGLLSSRTPLSHQQERFVSGIQAAIDSELADRQSPPGRFCGHLQFLLQSYELLPDRLQ
jgi:hypothetical protein